MDIDKIIPKFMRKGKGTRTAKAFLEKNKERGISLPNFNTYYIAIVIKTTVLVESQKID